MTLVRGHIGSERPVLITGGAGFIGCNIAAAFASRGRDVLVFDVTEEAEEAWTEIILSTARDNTAFMAACTPSRLNFEGNPSMFNPRNGSYGGGFGDVFGFRDLLAEWRANGTFAGWDLVEADKEA